MVYHVEYVFLTNEDEKAGLSNVLLHFDFMFNINLSFHKKDFKS